MTLSYMRSSKVVAAAELERRRRAAFVPYGSNREAWESTDKEALISGPAGTGKSRVWLQSLHRDALNYPGMRGLIVRKTRASISTSALVTFEQHVLGVGHPLITPNIRREHRTAYRYDNGSEIGIAGMDNPTRIMSTEYDKIYVQEAIELSLDEYESLTTRLRNGVMPYQQLCADTNPSFPTHWLKQRCDAGVTRLIFARHEDNPRLYSHLTGAWTDEGLSYLATLDRLTGIRRDRLRFGKWTQAEGIIYDNWDEATNVSSDAEYNPSLPILWGVDDGYAAGGGISTVSYHPRVVLLAQETARGGLNVFAEYVATQELSERTIDNVIAMHYPLPDVAYVDSSAAELKARIWERGIQTVGATHAVGEGIKNVRRMVCDGNGVRLIQVHPRCRHLIREFASYRYDDHSSVAVIGEPKPLKVDDHSLDALRYLAWHLRYSGV